MKVQFRYNSHDEMLDVFYGKVLEKLMQKSDCCLLWEPASLDHIPEMAEYLCNPKVYLEPEDYAKVTLEQKRKLRDEYPGLRILPTELVLKINPSSSDARYATELALNRACARHEMKNNQIEAKFLEAADMWQAMAEIQQLDLDVTFTLY